MEPGIRCAQARQALETTRPDAIVAAVVQQQRVQLGNGASADEVGEVVGRRAGNVAHRARPRLHDGRLVVQRHDGADEGGDALRGEQQVGAQRDVADGHQAQVHHPPVGRLVPHARERDVDGEGGRRVVLPHVLVHAQVGHHGEDVEGAVDVEAHLPHHLVVVADADELGNRVEQRRELGGAAHLHAVGGMHRVHEDAVQHLRRPLRCAVEGGFGGRRALVVLRLGVTPLRGRRRTEQRVAL
mmetsp:Transcript_28246/g.87542  ORF Transcript_28246/g.87542 Transcript_28246/m.87542 type:complete len:242 (-) Transcript_28246:406-1131(-)